MSDMEIELIETNNNHFATNTRLESKTRISKKSVMTPVFTRKTWKLRL